MKRFWLAIICSIVLVGLLVACTPTPTPSPTTSPTSTSTPSPTRTTPDTLVWAVLDVGSSSYTYAGIIAETIRDEFGVPVRLVPISQDVGKLTLDRIGQVNLAQLAGSAILARQGRGDFSGRAWGPQPLRMVYQTPGGGRTGVVTRGDSNIKTYSDLRGKRIPYVIGLPAHNDTIEGALAGFGNLTWDDVIKVEIPSYGATIDALIEGKTDIALVNITSANAVRIASSPGGIYWLPMPADNTVAWRILNDYAPGRFPSTTTTAPGTSASNPANIWDSPYVFDAYPSLDDDIAYFTTKAFVEAFPQYQDKHALLKEATLENVLDIVGKLAYAWHPGSISYFKEIGKWTPELEAWNNKVLAHEDQLMKAWEACLTEANANQVKETDLPALWDKYRKEVPDIQ